MHDIEITIDAEGNVEAKVKGMKGRGCLRVLQAFEQALGQSGATTATPEMYQAEENKVGQKTGR